MAEMARGGGPAEAASVRLRVGEGGRIVLPAAIRHALGIQVGDEVFLELKGGELRLTTAAEAIRRAQELVGQYVPGERSLATELLAERRAEAVGE